MAVEDIGLADPQALVICNAAKDAYDYLGSPEGELALAQACVYLATAPKSNAVYVAYKASMRAAKENGSLLPPKHILNAPTKLMKNEGYGDGYAYDHDQPDAFSGQDYFPESMGRQKFYDPPERVLNGYPQAPRILGAFATGTTGTPLKFEAVLFQRKRSKHGFSENFDL